MRGSLPLLAKIDGSRALALRHPLGLRALPEVAKISFDAGALVRATVTVGHLLECREPVEEWLSSDTRAQLVLSLRGPLSFSREDLAVLAVGVTEEQLERAVERMVRWATESPSRLASGFEGTFVVTPWTSITGLREHLDGIRRHGLRIDPLARLTLEGALADRARADGLVVEDGASVAGFRFRDPRLEAILAEALAGENDAEKLGRLERALEAIGVLPRPRGKRLRMLPPAKEKGERRGRIHEVALTRACNLACGFCSARGLETRTDRARAADAIRAVRAAALDGGTTLVLSGAEPTLEWYLDDVIPLAKSLGFERIVLETNAATLGEPGRAASLKEAGLSAARVAVNSFDARISDGITGVPGALARTLAGTRALLDAGIEVELAVALVPENEGELARVVESARTVLVATKARVERVVARVVHAGPELEAPLAIVDAARALVDAAHASMRTGLALVSAPGGELPPCAFDDLDDAAPVLRLSEGVVQDPNAASLYARIPACAGCAAKAVCPGVRRGLEASVSAVARPVQEGARVLPPAGERKRVLRELLSVVPSRRPDGSVDEQRIVRINFHCNQACDFCFVSRELPPPEEELVLAEIDEAARRGATLCFSGGEPTLNTRLLDYLARATALGVDHLELQTNAVKMSDPAYAKALASAGLKTAFVSLHGITAAVSDRVTRAPGTFVKTVDGIKNLLGAGVLTRLNFVLCGYNVAELAAWPDFVVRELAGAAGGAPVQINFSFAAASTANVPRDTALLPRFSDVAWALEAALARADALGIPLLGFDSQCGVPACFLPPRIREEFFATKLPPGAIREFSGAFKKGDACASCALDEHCYGVRTAYAEMYGTDELRPVPARPAS